MNSSKVLALALIGFIGGCSGEGAAESDAASGPSEPPPDEGCASDADCAANPNTPLCDVASGACLPLPPGHQIGWKDGSPGTVAFVPIYEPDKLRAPMDLAFNPTLPTELWVVNHDDDSVIVIENPGAPDVKWQRKKDPDAMHFMRRPPAIAFGAVSLDWGQTFAVCGDGNDGGSNFMGPALFTADAAFFAKATPGGLGSHLDMLHSTTFCRGIAHVFDNVYFVFNSTKGALDRYDFGQDHGPGNDDHSDGQIYRYIAGELLGVDGIPSHLAYNPADFGVYVADTGNQRIVKLDASTGTIGSSFSGLEDVAARKYMDDALLVEVVPWGTLEAPSGIELHGGLLYVSDMATSRFYVFDLAGHYVRHLDTGFPPGSIAGFAFGPTDGNIYFADMLSSWVFRIDPLH